VGASVAIRRACANTAAASSASGSTFSRKPASSRRCAPWMLAASSMSRASASPIAPCTSAASRGAIGNPSLAIGAPNFADAADRRMSQQLAISIPAPMQAPSMRATSGSSQASIAASAAQTSSSWNARRRATSKRNEGYSEMSPPAQKAPPSPPTTTQRSAGMCANRSKASRSSRHMPRVIALSRPGFDRVTKASGPSTRRSIEAPRLGAALIRAWPPRP